eukprot:360407_1
MEKLFNKFKECYEESNTTAYNVTVSIRSNSGMFIVGQFNHIHAQYLIPNYLEQRNSSNCSIREYMNRYLSVKKKSPRYIEDETIIYILSHFGHYYDIISLDVSDKHLWFIGCSEYYDEIAQFLPSNPVYPTFLVASDKKACNTIIFSKFISYYIFVTMLSVKNISYNRNRACAHYRRNKTCDECLITDNMCELYLGYLMVFWAEDIHNQLQSISGSLLVSKLRTHHEQFGNNVKKMHLKLLQSAKLLKCWTVNDFQTKGQEYVRSSFRYYQNMVENKIKDVTLFQYVMFHIYGKMLSFVGLDTFAIGLFVLAACTTNDLYEKILSLKSLITSCYTNKQYLIGMKVLNCAYKLCNGYIFKLFTGKMYRKQKKKFVIKIKTMKCSNCSKGNCKLKSCSGCMNVSYCSVSCQKIHWKTSHRDNCDQSWGLGAYAMIKDTIFHRL